MCILRTKKQVASAATARNGKTKAAAPEPSPAQKRKPVPPPDVVEVKDNQVALPSKPPALDRKAVSGMLTALKYAADPFSLTARERKRLSKHLRPSANLHITELK